MDGPAFAALPRGLLRRCRHFPWERTVPKLLSTIASAVLAAGCLAVLPAVGRAASPPRDPANGSGQAVLPAWQRGYLDIHHISTGSGNAAYFILPDGTTMLFDAGDVDRDSMKANAPLRVLDPRPDGHLRAGEWIVDYIRQFAPTGRPVRLDYAIVSHFHSDHFGHVSASSPMSRTGAYQLGGLLDVAEAIPIDMLIDRAAPDYQTPVDLRRCADDARGTLGNYLRYVDYRRRHSQAVEALHPGRRDQIVLKHARKAFRDFAVRNLAANGVQWTGRGNEVARRIPADAFASCGFSENPFSLAIKLSYGAFDYYSGGDTTGMDDDGQSGPLDMETSLGPAVGPVDVMTLNHHGNRDATNENFLWALRPRIIVQQSWISDQPGGEVVHRMASRSIFPGARDILATGIRPETRIAIGPWMEKAYASFDGHVVIRVAPGGARYEVFVLDDMDRARRVLRRFGPFLSDGPSGMDRGS